MIALFTGFTGNQMGVPTDCPYKPTNACILSH